LGRSTNDAKLEKMILIRTAETSDAKAIADVHVATWRTTYAGLLPDTVLLGITSEGEQRHWRRVIAIAKRDFVVQLAETADGEVIGYGSAGPTRESSLPFSAEVYTLYVAPDHQGQGCGRLLLAAMLKQLQAQGHGSAMLWVLAANPARFFYQAMGGVVAAERRERHFGVALNETAYGWSDLLQKRSGDAYQLAGRGAAVPDTQP
jgi:L-amino acid N-acyltransferase YncA